MIDLLVAGGGPAGLATALRAARAGLKTVVVERRRGPIDKACGEGLMPHTVRQLDSLGIQLHGKPFRGITYLDSARRVDAPFRSGLGMGMRRTALHAGLLDALSESRVAACEPDRVLSLRLLNTIVAVETFRRVQDPGRVPREPLTDTA